MLSPLGLVKVSTMPLPLHVEGATKRSTRERDRKCIDSELSVNIKSKRQKEKICTSGLTLNTSSIVSGYELCRRHSLYRSWEVTIPAVIGHSALHTTLCCAVAVYQVNAMFETPQFVTGPFTARRVFLPDREYGLALDALVKGCSDVLAVSSDSKKLLLGRRKVEPQPDWWFIGGRSKPGDTTTAAAARNVKRELGLDFSESRFEVVANFSMVWSYREQAPTENGTADLSTIHTVHLTKEEEEMGVPSLDPKEYHESKWWDIEELLSQDDRFHPCLLSSIKTLKAKWALNALEIATEENMSLEKDVIAEKALQFIKAMKDARSTESSVKVLFDAEACKYVRQDEDSAMRQEVKNGDHEGKKKSR